MHGSETHKNVPDIPTPKRPNKMTGFRPILLYGVIQSASVEDWYCKANSESLAQWYTVKNWTNAKIDSCEQIVKILISPRCHEGTHYETRVKSYSIWIVGYPQLLDHLVDEWEDHYNHIRTPQLSTSKLILTSILDWRCMISSTSSAGLKATHWARQVVHPSARRLVHREEASAPI